jgi:hypothetical protein
VVTMESGGEAKRSHDARNRGEDEGVS